MRIPLKKIILYGLPPVLWMIFLFPLANDYLSSSDFYNFTYTVLKSLFPQMTYQDFGLMYIIVRKLIHFFGYAVLALLLFRAFYGFSAKGWDSRWLLYAALIAVGYGILDESIQAILPNRHGNVLDVVIDTSGVCIALASVWFCRRKAASPV